MLGPTCLCAAAGVVSLHCRVITVSPICSVCWHTVHRCLLTQRLVVCSSLWDSDPFLWFSRSGWFRPQALCHPVLRLCATLCNGIFPVVSYVTQDQHVPARTAVPDIERMYNAAHHSSPAATLNDALSHPPLDACMGELKIAQAPLIACKSGRQPLDSQCSHAARETMPHSLQCFRS